VWLDAGLAMNMSRDRIPAVTLPSATLGKLFIIIIITTTIEYLSTQIIITSRTQAPNTVELSNSGMLKVGEKDKIWTGFTHVCLRHQVV